MKAIFELVSQYWIIPALGGLATGFAGWLFRRKETNVKVQGSEIDNLERIVQMWQKTAEAFESQYREIMKQNEEMMDKINALRRDRNKLHRDLCAVKEENEKLRKEVGELNELVRNLTKTNTELVKKLKSIDHCKSN